MDSQNGVFDIHRITAKRKLSEELPAALGNKLKDKLVYAIEMLEKHAYDKATSLDHYQRSLDERVQRLKVEAAKVRMRVSLYACMHQTDEILSKSSHA